MQQSGKACDSMVGSSSLLLYNHHPHHVKNYHDDDDQHHSCYDADQDDDDHTITTHHTMNKLRWLHLERETQHSPSSVVVLESQEQTSSTTTMKDETATVPMTSNIDTAPTSSTIPKPFFFMDELEYIDPQSLLLVQQVLQQQQKQRYQNPTRCTTTTTSCDVDDDEVIASKKNKRMMKSSSITPTTTTTTHVNNKSLIYNVDQQPKLPHLLIPILCNSNNIQKDILPKQQSSYCNNSNNNHNNNPFIQQSIRIGNRYNARGIQYAKHGLWDQAIYDWNIALDIRKQIYGNYDENDDTKTNSIHHIEIANIYNNIGIAYGKQQLYDKGIEMLQYALYIRYHIYGCSYEHHEITTTLHNIGNIYQQQHDQLSMALQYYSQCKILQEIIYHKQQLEKRRDDDEPQEAPSSSQQQQQQQSFVQLIDIARTCIAMGHTYTLAYAYMDAREAYQDAIHILEQIMNQKQHDHTTPIDPKYDNNNNDVLLEYHRTIQELESIEHHIANDS